jgi:predicted dehydrogenase
MTVRVGVVGLGAMGRTHLLAYAGAEGAGFPCRVVAVCDRSTERLSGRVAASGNIDVGGADRLFDPAIVFTTTDPEALFSREDVDLVSICTRTDTHVALAIFRAAEGQARIARESRSR